MDYSERYSQNRKCEGIKIDFNVYIKHLVWRVLLRWEIWSSVKNDGVE